MITPATTRNGPGFMDLSGIVTRPPGLAPESMQVIEKLAATANPPIVWDTVPAMGEVSLRAQVVQQIRELAEHFAPSGRMSDVASVWRVIVELLAPEGGTELASALSAMAGTLTALGQIDEALSARRRVFHLLRDLAGRGPGRLVPVGPTKEISTRICWPGQTAPWMRQWSAAK